MEKGHLSNKNKFKLQGIQRTLILRIIYMVVNTCQLVNIKGSIVCSDFSKYKEIDMNNIQMFSWNSQPEL